MLDFASDNVYGVAPEIMAALAAANHGSSPSYGADDGAAAVEAALGDVFERPVRAFLVATGSAANSISLAALSPPWGAVFCHREAHVHVDECGGPEFFGDGLKLVPLSGPDGKFDAAALRAELANWPEGFVHTSQPAAATLTQASEAGAVYRPDEIAAIAEAARGRGLKLHMDGARFANAVIGTGASPAELTWKAGVDMLSFGATKNGCMGVEAIVLFSDDPALAWEVELRRKRGGHLISKGRFLSAQMAAYLEAGRWLDYAAHANAMASRLAAGLEGANAVRIAHPVEANMVFLDMTPETATRLEAAGARFFAHGLEGHHRFVASFATEPAEVDGLIAAIKDLD